METSGRRSSRPYAFSRGQRGIQYIEIVKSRADHLFKVINSRDDLLRRLMRWCAYLRYVEARLANRVLYADEILKDGFFLNMIKTPLCRLKILKNMQEAVRDDDIVLYGRKRVTTHVIISLAKGVEAEFEPHPRIITHAQMIYRACKFSFHVFLKCLLDECLMSASLVFS
ncbi:hypothetical protein YC2023_023036 [Brassica napus]